MQQRSRVKDGVQTGVQERSDVGTEVSKVSITMVSIFAAVVGLWSFACIVGGLIASGGPLAFVKSWFGAVSGM
jgi:hypothetical protein